MAFSELERAEQDLAFALAQGDALAEDEASERIRRLREEIRDEEDALEAGESL